jgi:hypothetical protein
MMNKLPDFFPIPYEMWYAATLFLDAGYPRDEVLRRVGLDEAAWKACDESYHDLLYVLRTYTCAWRKVLIEECGEHDVDKDFGLYQRLIKGSVFDLPAPPEPFSMRELLRALSKIVEANPRIGVFSDVDWVAVYLGERYWGRNYVHNGQHVLFDGKPLWTKKREPLEGIDPFSFRQLDERWFCDKNRVYGQAEKPTRIFWFAARGADPATFQVLNERYGRDKSAAYYITGRRIAVAEPESFQIVGYYIRNSFSSGFRTYISHYAKDSQKVYCAGMPIEGADAASFQSIGDEGVYFADKNRVYFQNKPIEGADRASFTCASERGQYRAYDKFRPYYHGWPESVSEEFEEWREYFESRPELTDTWWHHEKARRSQ